MVEGGGLENRCTGLTGTVGSNPTLSARIDASLGKWVHEAFTRYVPADGRVDAFLMYEEFCNPW